MATALAKGLVSSQFVAVDEIVATDVSPTACEGFTAATGAQTIPGIDDLLARSNVVFLAVKPQHMAPVLTAVAPHANSTHLIISIAAGVPLRTMIDALGQDCRLVRVMPNTPCLVGAGASAYALAPGANSQDGELVERLLSTTGIAVSVPESLLDGVTGLSGSGPAYVFQIIEALSDGGVRCGLPRDVSMKLAAQTVFGAAKLVLETGEHPAALKDAVASPGGTTIAGLNVLESQGVRGSLIDAVRAATEQSRQLGRSS